MTRILVWGASPLGGWLAARLPHNKTVWLTDEATVTDVTRLGGLELVNPQGREKIEGVRVVADLKVALAPMPDWIIFAMPGWAVSRALTDLAMLFPPEKLPYALSLQPGIGNLEKIAALFGEEKSLRVVVTQHFAWPTIHEGKASARETIVTDGRGGVAVSKHPQAALISEIFKAAGLGTARIIPAESLGWSDVFWRIHANALPTLLNLSPAAIYDDPMLFELEYRQLREALAVIDRLKINLVKLPGVDVPRLAWQVRLLAPRWLAGVLKRNTHQPSLRADLETKTGRSDAAYLNGAVAKAAYDLRLAAPVNHVLALSLTDIAEGRAQWGQFQNNLDYLQTLIRVAGRHI